MNQRIEPSIDDVFNLMAGHLPPGYKIYSQVASGEASVELIKTEGFQRLLSPDFEDGSENNIGVAYAKCLTFAIRHYLERQEKLFIDVGAQVAYVPNHVAKDNLLHKDVEFGFIERYTWDSAVCRYWNRNPREGLRLRTLANGERCSIENLVPFVMTDQANIDKLLKLIQKGELTEENQQAILGWSKK